MNASVLDSQKTTHKWNNNFRTQPAVKKSPYISLFVTIEGTYEIHQKNSGSFTKDPDHVSL